MTELRPLTARLRLGPALEGRLYVRDSLQQLLLELNTARGQVVTLGVPAGSYTVTLEGKGETSEVAIAVMAGEIRALDRTDFRVMPREMTALRGASAPEAELDDGSNRETPSLLAKAELTVGQTLHGAAQGVLFCVQVGCSSSGTAALGVVAGLGLATVLTRHVDHPKAPPVTLLPVAGSHPGVGVAMAW
jgi:hypothetical protein